MVVLNTKYGTQHFFVVNFSQVYCVIIDRGISAPGYGREVVYGINATEKGFSSS